MSSKCSSSRVAARSAASSANLSVCGSPVSSTVAVAPSLSIQSGLRRASSIARDSRSGSRWATATVSISPSSSATLSAHQSANSGTSSFDATSSIPSCELPCAFSSPARASNRWESSARFTSVTSSIAVTV